MPLTIGAAARASGVGVQTLRYYERRGLLSTTLRSQAGYRLFTPDAVRRVLFIRRAQELGFTLSEIGELLALRVRNGRRCAGVKRAAEHTRARGRARMADLRRMDRSLRDLVHACGARRSTDECPILSALEAGGGT